MEADDTRDTLKLSAYLILALPVPLLSERHRLLPSIYGGCAKKGSLDRFSAFRIGGGPIPTESYDLARNPLPGAMFNQFPVERYLMATLEYRFEFFFFTYLHARVTYVNARVATRRRRGGFQNLAGFTVSAAITTGFVWNSQVFVSASQDLSGAVRGGQSGTTILFLWSKAF